MEQETNLRQLLDQVERLAGADGSTSVSVEEVMDAFGRRSFGPILVIAGLITLAPVVGDIPGVPTLAGTLVLLTAVQILFRRDHVWFPHWLLRRSVGRDKLRRGVRWLRPLARLLDHISRPRLVAITCGAGGHGVAITCLLIAVSMPPMELIPFSANGAGFALAAFGIALVAHDGLFAILAFAGTAVTAGAIVYNLF